MKHGVRGHIHEEPYWKAEIEDWYTKKGPELEAAVYNVNEFWRFQAELRPKHFNYLLISCAAAVGGLTQWPAFSGIILVLVIIASIVFLLLDFRIMGQINDSKEAFRLLARIIHDFHRI